MFQVYPFPSQCILVVTFGFLHIPSSTATSPNLICFQICKSTLPDNRWMNSHSHRLIQVNSWSCQLYLLLTINGRNHRRNNIEFRTHYSLNLIYFFFNHFCSHSFLSFVSVFVGQVSILTWNTVRNNGRTYI